MLFFVIKKAFFDMWDNIVAIILLNVSMICLLCLFFFGATLFKDFPIPLFIYLIAGLIVMNFPLGAIFRYTQDISDYKKGGFRVFFTYLGKSWKQSITSSMIMILEAAILFYVIPYYYFNGSILFMVLGTLMFWVWLTILIACFIFFPVCFRLKKKMLKNIQTCFFILFDNFGFTIFMFLGVIILVPLSFLLLFLIPGPAAVILWINVCFKIRMYKYNYLEENPEANKKKIPWNVLILTDREKVGKRTLRGMIFPWKD